MIGGILILSVAAVMHGSRRVRLGVAAIGACLLVDPIVAFVLAGAGVAVIAVRRIIRRTREADAGAIEELLAIDLMALGVSGGLTFHQAVTFAGAAVGGPVAERLERRTRHLLAGGTTDASDAIGSVFAAAARSASSGAPLRPALDAVAESVRRERAAAERMRLARLPVKLLFPLALLILPGFVLLAVAPAVISGLSRLTG